jgi:hypothetical protein
MHHLVAPLFSSLAVWPSLVVWQRHLTSLLLALSLLITGCAATGPPAPADAGAPGDPCACADGAGLATSDGGAERGLRPARHGKAAAWVAAGFLLAAVVTIDLLILPFTVHHHPFPCCRAVLHLCH